MNRPAVLRALLEFVGDFMRLRSPENNNHGATRNFLLSLKRRLSQDFIIELFQSVTNLASSKDANILTINFPSNK